MKNQLNNIYNFREESLERYDHINNKIIKPDRLLLNLYNNFNLLALVGLFIDFNLSRSAVSLNFPVSECLQFSVEPDIYRRNILNKNIVGNAYVKLRGQVIC